MNPPAQPQPGLRRLVSLRRLFPILAPAVVIACFLAVYLLDDRPSEWREARFPDESEQEIIEFPHGRVLYVIVEPEGVYIGEERISFEGFSDYLKARKRTLSPDFFIIAAQIPRATATWLTPSSHCARSSALDTCWKRDRSRPARAARASASRNTIGTTETRAPLSKAKFDRTFPAP